MTAPVIAPIVPLACAWQGEEEFKLSIKHKQHQADQHLQEQRDQIAQLHERKKILASARENERLHCVQRTRRAQEHILQRQVQRHMEMERRASGLQDERRALIAERAKSAKTLALQRAAVQEQFKKARSVGDLKKSKSMLAEIGIDLDTLTAISETMLSSTSIAGARSLPSDACPEARPLSPHLAPSPALRSLRPQAGPGRNPTAEGARPQTRRALGRLPRPLPLTPPACSRPCRRPSVSLPQPAPICQAPRRRARARASLLAGGRAQRRSRRRARGAARSAARSRRPSRAAPRRRAGA